MLLTIDIGNTNIVAAMFEAETLKEHFRIETDKKSAHKIFTDFLGDCPSFSKKKGTVPKGISKEIEAVAISSVVPALNKEFSNLSKRILKITPFFITHKAKLGMEIKVDNPSEVGADRLVNAVAGKKLYGSPVIIIDLGTATTIDVVSKQGNYIGGVIAPGIKIGMEALFSKTAKLPKVELKKPKNVIGKNTVNCIQSGLIYGIIGNLEYMVKMIKKELKHDAKVIATGGFSGLIAKESKVIDCIDEFLTLKGIRIVYELNK